MESPCFYIRSKMHSKVLDVRGANTRPGAQVIVYTKKTELAGTENQQWYTDWGGVIRSRLNDYALDSSRGEVVLNPYDCNNHNQQWVMMGDRIALKHNPNTCLDIMNQDMSDGARLCAYEFTGGQNQLWIQDYTGHHHDVPGQPPPAQPAYPPPAYPGHPGAPAQPTWPPSYPVGPAPPGYPVGPAPPGQPGWPAAPPAQPSWPPGNYAPPAQPTRRQFVISSMMHGKVLDVQGGSAAPGSRVIVWPKKPGRAEPNQLWYSDTSGVIRSALNDYAFDTSSGRSLVLQPYNGSPPQQWIVEGERIVNRCQPDLVLDIARNDRADGAEIIAYDWNGGANQRWRCEHI